MEVTWIVPGAWEDPGVDWPSFYFIFCGAEDETQIPNMPGMCSV
jgi:hypothetical protein